MGFSILDIFKPIGITILICGITILCILNPITSFTENKFIEITDQKNSDIYSIKFIQNGKCGAYVISLKISLISSHSETLLKTKIF